MGNLLGGNAKEKDHKHFIYEEVGCHRIPKYLGALTKRVIIYQIFVELLVKIGDH